MRDMMKHSAAVFARVLVSRMAMMVMLMLMVNTSLHAYMHARANVCPVC